MATKENGGPAFPQAIAVGLAGDVYPGFPGMTLRDWFAGQAMAAIVQADGAQYFGSFSSHAAAAYAQADAMLAERSK